MKTDESWVAEQARLLILEDGFGPGHSTASSGSAGAAMISEEPEAGSPRLSSG